MPAAGLAKNDEAVKWLESPFLKAAGFQKPQGTLQGGSRPFEATKK